MAPCGGEAVLNTAGGELESRHSGGRRWVPSEPVSRQLEGTVPVFVCTQQKYTFSFVFICTVKCDILGFNS